MRSNYSNSLPGGNPKASLPSNPKHHLTPEKLFQHSEKVQTLRLANSQNQFLVSALIFCGDFGVDFFQGHDFSRARGQPLGVLVLLEVGVTGDGAKRDHVSGRFHFPPTFLRAEKIEAVEFKSAIDFSFLRIE